MVRRGVVGIVGVVAAVVGLVACEDPAGLSSDATLALTVDRVVMDVGGTQVIPLVAMDGARTLDAGDLTWTTSDPSTAGVDGGVVTAKAPGVVMVWAEAGRARDSVRVRVRVPDLGTGELAARVQGEAGGETDRFSGFASQADFLVGDYGSVTTITQAEGGAGDPDAFQVQIHIPGTLGVGTVHLGATDVVDVAGTALVVSGEAGGVGLYRPAGDQPTQGGAVRFEAWLGVGEPELEIEEMSPASGLVQGRMRGNVSFEAAGVLLEYDGDVQHVVGPLADTTVHVYMEFDVPLRHDVVGGGAYAVDGPFGSGSGTLTGSAIQMEGGALGNLGGLLPPPAGDSIPRWVSNVRAWLPDPSAGEVTIPPSGGEIVGLGGVGATVPWVQIELSPVNTTPRGERQVAVSRGGSWTLAEYTPPTQTERGLLRGHYVVEMEVWDGVQLTGTTFSLEGDALLPVYPEQWPDAGVASPPR